MGVHEDALENAAKWREGFDTPLSLGVKKKVRKAVIHSLLLGGG